MVEFLTLFLGLTLGSQAVELNVAGPVASVEVRLDDETLAILTSEPWTVVCDLGNSPMPHDLVAIARDKNGHELDRAAQWINLGARRTGATLAVRSDSSGRARSLSVDWESIGQPNPAGIEVTFDGQPIDVADPDHIPLPPHQGGEFHYVSANVRFTGHDDNLRETDFGSLRATEVSSELTAIVVNLEKRSRLPALKKMRSWFQKKGAPVPIHGTEKGEMDLYIVREAAAHEALDRLAQAVVRNSYEVGSELASQMIDWHPQRFFAAEQKDPKHSLQAHLEQLLPLRQHGSLSHRLRLSFVSPRPGPLTPTGLTHDMFVRSRTYSGDEGGLDWLFQQQQPMTLPSRVSDAVALTGMKAHAGNRRRAVLLVTTGNVKDTSEYSTEMTRQYLRALGVPLYIWSFSTEPTDHPWAEGSYPLGNPARPLAAARRLERASALLQRDFKNQRVIWLKGRHLPHQITLGPEASGISLAAADDVGPDSDAR